MSEHRSKLSWQRRPHPEDAETFCRNHVSTLNGGQIVNVSSAAGFKGDPDCADPEQLLVSAVSSCHMLTFLAIADIKGFTVESYEDDAVGFLEKGDRGMAVTRIELNPKITFSGDKQPDAAALEKLHAGAHRNCFIGNSITSDVVVNG